MAITSSGIGSNLDVNGIVSQLMALEQRPLTALQTKEAGYQSKISALGSLNGAISALQTAAAALMPAIGQTATERFSVFKTSVTDATIASATASGKAVAGSYSLEVTQLAKQHQIATSATTSPFSGPDGTLPTGGTLTITLDTQSGSTEPGKTTNVEIADGATPEAVRDAINAASAGVSATVINGTAGKQLVLVADNPGSKQFIRLAGVAGLAYDPAAAEGLNDPFVQKQAAQGSAFLINGIPATADSNTVVTVIDGITLTLAKTNVGEPTTLTLTRDTSGLTTAVNAFVKAYNDVNTTSNNLGSYNAASKTAGALNGESIVRSAQNAFRSILGNVPSELADLSDTSLKTLSAIGVSLQKDGSLKVDADKLKTAVTGDLTGVANLLSAYGSAFKTAADGIVGTTGTIATRTEGLNTAIKGLGKQSEALTARLAQIEARYRKQFLALDTLMSSMTQTSSFLQQQLANLPSINSSN